MTLAVNLDQAASSGWFDSVARAMGADLVVTSVAALAAAIASQGTATRPRVLVVAHAPVNRESIVALRRGNALERLTILFVSSQPGDFPPARPETPGWEGCYFLRKMPWDFAASQACAEFISGVEDGDPPAALLEPHHFPSSLILAYLSPLEGLSDAAQLAASAELKYWEAQATRRGLMAPGEASTQDDLGAVRIGTLFTLLGRAV